MDTTTPHPTRTATQAAIHTSQHMRVVTNVLPTRQRALVTRVTQLEICWDAGELRMRFAMRECKQRTALPDARQDGARKSVRTIGRM